MKKVLFVFWHGLGDNILATPCIRQYKLQTGNSIGWMMIERIKSAQFFNDNPYIDNIHWCPDAWKIYGERLYKYGALEVFKEAKKIALEYKYDDIKFISHGSSSKHKIFRTADEMGIELDTGDLHTEFHYNPENCKEHLSKIKLPEKYVFFNGRTGVKKKNLPIEFVRTHMKKESIDLPIVSPDFSWDISKVPMSVCAEVLKRASNIYVADSAIYHLAHALDLKIDLAYFQRGKRIWDIVKPLHENTENVIFSLKSKKDLKSNKDLGSRGKRKERIKRIRRIKAIREKRRINKENKNS
jgi:hypothetical protein